MNIEKISIDSIGLSNRASNCLHRAGVSTVGEMMVYTEERLSAIRNMGRKSIDEVLDKIREYRDYQSESKLTEQKARPEASIPAVPEDFAVFADSDQGKEYIRFWLKESGYRIGDLDYLSARAYNRLFLNGITGLDMVMFMNSDTLMKIPRMDLQTANEIEKSCRQFLEGKREDIIASLEQKHSKEEQNSVTALRVLLHSQENHDIFLQFFRANDEKTEELSLSNRAKNSLLRNGRQLFSEFVFMTEKDLQEIPQIGSKSVEEILAFIDNYLGKNENRIRAVLSSGDSEIWDEDTVREIVLSAYTELGFSGLSLLELREKAAIPKQISDECLKKILGRLVAEGKLEYVDYRCYRVYPRFMDYLTQCAAIDDRSREFIGRRLQGETLEVIAADHAMTKERVRQIVNKKVNAVRSQYAADTGMTRFDEDYYRYFYETYVFEKKDAEEWLGIDKTVFNYMEMTGAARGTKPLDEAQDDYRNLDYGFRLKIKNYLNRNKLFLDGRWVGRNRMELEEYVVCKYCRGNVSYDDFIVLYNEFLRAEEVPYDEDIYLTDAVKRVRENRLSGARFLLWKQNRQIRYYDIDGQDYTELLETLNLDAYENVEYSTWKFVRDFPEIMEKYDIRDQYELHNLLRKIIKDGDYHDFHCERTPIIRFGLFDRDGALLDLLIDNAPISMQEFAGLVHREYGYDPGTVMGTYLRPLSPFYHNGMYTIDQKAMTAGNKKALLAKLTEDFYYMDEIRKTYAQVVPDADLEEINPYNLKLMGFSVLSRYVYRNYSTLDAYFRNLLLREDVTDLSPYRNRYAYVVSFSGTLINMKREREILEFEPNQVITFRKLAEAGVTREDLQTFCDGVADFVDKETYFSVQSIKKEGFESELFDLGFSDWFYASLLSTDDRFSNTKAFCNIILYSGKKRITIQSFEESLIKEHSSIDVYDLMTEMENTYGCQIPDRLDLIYKVKGTDVYHDQYMDRLYANTGVFSRELDAAEGM